MAQPIAPEVWNKAALEDNRLLPARYSIGIFTGKGVNIANNQSAYVYDEMLVSDRIFDYDDRRLNGLAGQNSEGRDGWGASAYGPMQSVRFERRVFTSGQHKSIAWRIFDEKQYSGAIGDFGTATASNAISGGQEFLSTAETIRKAKEIWNKEILGPHIDKYNFFAIANGHISGRFVQKHAKEGRMFDGEGQWIACPGPYQGVAIQPEFAPIKAIEWDSMNVRPMLNAIDVAWTNLFIPNEDRVIVLDKAYKDDLLSNLIGVPGSVPASDKAYDALVEGRFERFYGWDFDFSVPSQYFPKVYLDANNNVVHSADGNAAFDAVLNSISAPDGTVKLQSELSESQRMRATNYFGTYYDEKTKKFVNVVTNYPLGMPAGTPYLANEEAYVDPDFGVQPGQAYPYMGFPGSGIKTPTGPVKPITRRQVIGMAVYRKAAQLGEEYGSMETAQGGTRGKFTELVFDMKHDAWVIPNLSHGILLIVDSKENIGTPSIKVEDVSAANNTVVEPKATSIKVAPKTMTLKVGDQKSFTVTVVGQGAFDKGWTAESATPAQVEVDDSGRVTALAKTTGAVNVTVTSIQTPTVTATVAVTVN